MIYKHEVLFKNGKQVTIETDLDLVKEHAIWKSGYDLDAPPKSSDEPMQSPTMMRPALRGSAFVSEYFSIDLCDIAFIKRVGGMKETEENEEEGE